MYMYVCTYIRVRYAGETIVERIRIGFIAADISNTLGVIFS